MGRFVFALPSLSIGLPANSAPAFAGRRPNQNDDRAEPSPMIIKAPAKAETGTLPSVGDNRCRIVAATAIPTLMDSLCDIC